MLIAAIESRSREDLAAAVALATQLRLRSPQVTTGGLRAACVDMEEVAKCVWGL